jgi:hypothetical protein
VQTAAAAVSVVTVRTESQVPPVKSTAELAELEVFHLPASAVTAQTPPKPTADSENAARLGTSRRPAITEQAAQVWAGSIQKPCGLEETVAEASAARTVKVAVEVVVEQALRP